MMERVRTAARTPLVRCPWRGWLAGLGLALLACPAGAQERSAWSYGTQHDEMRQADYQYAQNPSQGIVGPGAAKDMPIHATLSVARVGDTIGAGFIVDGGKLDCPMMTGCRITVSFDKKPAVSMRAKRVTSSDFSTLAIGPAEHLAREALGSQSMIVEIAFQKHGLLQFQFNLSGFDPARIGGIPPEKTQADFEARMEQKYPWWTPQTQPMITP